MAAYEFKDIATVDVAGSVSDAAHVLVEDGGVIKRLPKEEVGSGTVKSVNGTEPDENGNVELSVAASWDDLENKPFYEEVKEIVTFDGDVELYHGEGSPDGLTEPDYSYIGSKCILYINDTPYEGVIAEHRIVMVPYYKFDCGIEILFDSLTPSSDIMDLTGTYRMKLVIMNSKVTPIDKKYIPKSYVSFTENQNLSYDEQQQAKENLGLYTNLIEKYVILEDRKESSMSPTDGAIISIDLNEHLYNYDVNYIEVFSYYRNGGGSSSINMNVLVPVMLDNVDNTTVCIYNYDKWTIQMTISGSGTPRIVFMFNYEGGTSSYYVGVTNVNAYKLNVNTTYIN